jgi:hypothetical protein
MTLGTEQAQQRLNTLSAMVVGGLAFLVIFSISIMGLLVWLAFTVSGNTHQIQENANANTTALCALRRDIKLRRDGAVTYLADHPDGLTDKYGNVLISKAQLAKSIHDQTATLNSLVGLNCDGSDSP